MSDSQIYITVLIALISGLGGTVVGALLAELGIAFRVYREDKRKLKRLLYNQLDLWFELKRTDFNSLLPVVFKQIGRALEARGVPAEEVKIFTEGTPPELFLLFRSVSLGDPSKVIKRYEESVRELAEIDPILAHTLSSPPEDLQKYFDDFFGKVKEMSGGELPPGSEGETVDRLVSWSKDEALQRKLKGIKKDILAVSRRIHIWTWFRAKREFERFDKKLDVGVARQADEFVESLAQLAYSLSQASPTDAPEKPSQPPAADTSKKGTS